MSEENPDAIFKLLIIGDSGVGKSCFLLQFIEGDFKEDHNVTIGVEYGAKAIKVGNKLIKLQIWDTAGQESFRAITRSFYRNAHAVILMYDLTRKETFVNLDEWLREVRQNANREAVVYLVGNMLDIAEEREVTTDEAQTYAKEEKLDGFTEASAKTAENVTDVSTKQVFIKVAETLYAKEAPTAEAAPPSPDNPPPIQIQPQPIKPAKKGCC